MRLLYFAWVRSRLGLAEETVSPPAEVRDVASLLAWLRARGQPYAEVLANPAVLRCAVNQIQAAPDHPIGPGDEVAIFPPVTGG